MYGVFFPCLVQIETLRWADFPPKVSYHISINTFWRPWTALVCSVIQEEDELYFDMASKKARIMEPQGIVSC
jgi:hypothetical protein